VDELADPKPAGALAKLRDLAGDVRAEDHRRTRAHERLDLALADPPVDRVDAARVDLDQDLPAAGCGRGPLLVAQHVDVAEPGHDDGLHGAQRGAKEAASEEASVHVWSAALHS